MKNTGADCLQLATLRLDWAGQRIDEFKREVEAFIDRKPYDVTRSVQPKGNNRYRIIYQFRVLHDAPIPLRFRAAEAVHHLRAAVDNVLWGLGQICGASMKLSLIFVDDPAEYAQRAKRLRITQLPAAIVNWISSEQVHVRPDAKLSPLRLLNDLWNFDKHRTPALLGSALYSTAVGSNRGVVEVENMQTFYQYALRDGDVVLAADITANRVTDFGTHFTCTVAFDNGIEPAVTFLRNVENHIRTDVLPKFAPFLT